MSKAATGSLEVSGMTSCQTRHNGTSIDRVRGFRTLQEIFKKRGRWRAFSSVARYDKSSCLEADCHSLALPKVEHVFPQVGRASSERTFVPISWMCKKQTSSSHSSTESEVVSLDAGLRLDARSMGCGDQSIAFLMNVHQAVRDYCRKEKADDPVPRSRAHSEMHSTTSHTKSTRNSNPRH